MKDKMNPKELIKILNEATIKYETGHPIMSDEQWDDLYFQLKEFEETTGIIYPNSPVRTLSVYQFGSLTKVTHNHPMLSLDKTKSLASIEAFAKNHAVVAMAKMDGLTCSLTYKNGELYRAETRGNGVEGEDVTYNVEHIKNVPIKIPTDKPVVIIDGEVICTYQDFEPFKNDYRNPRNFAAGSIRLHDPYESQRRNLTFIAWDGIEGFDETTLIGKLDTIINYGFDIVPWEIENPKDAIIDIQLKCQEESYPIDGIVFKYNNCAEYEAAGCTEHHFNGGIAYKFYDDLYDTQLLDIEWSMGKTGVLTPVAIFEPVEIDGAIIERASLHNVSLLRDVFNGTPFKHQPMRIYKANQIIPQVYDASGSLDNTPVKNIIVFPKVCPCCGEPLDYRYDGISEYCFCDNKACSGRLVNRLDHFFGKRGLNIKGLSEATFEKLIEWGWVNSIIDVFHLEKYREEWITKTGFGPKSVENLLNSIDAGRKCELSAFLAGLGIPLVGSKYAKIIAEHMTNYAEFRNAIKTGFNFMTYDGIGPEINDSIINFDYTEADNLDIFELTIFNHAKIQEHITNQVLQNQTFVITGRLQLYKNRDALVKEIESYGGKVVNSVSKNTNYLINNDINSTSSKNKTAKQLNIPIITEEEFSKQLSSAIIENISMPPI